MKTLYFLAFYTLINCYHTYSQEPILNFNNSNRLLFNPASHFRSDYRENSPFLMGTGTFLNTDKNGKVYSTFYANGIFDINNETNWLGVIIKNDNYNENNTFSLDGVFSKSVNIKPILISFGIKAGLHDQNTYPKNIFDRYDPFYVIDSTQMGEINRSFFSFGAGLIINVPKFLSNNVALTFGLSTSHFNEPVEFAEGKKNRLPIRYSGLFKSDFYIRRSTLSLSMVYEFQDKRIFDRYLEKYLVDESKNISFFLEGKNDLLIIGYGYRYLFEKPPAHFIRIGFNTYINLAFSYDLGFVYKKNINNINLMLNHQITATYMLQKRSHMTGLL